MQFRGRIQRFRGTVKIRVINYTIECYGSEGYKGWIEISADEMFPAAIPPNDDLDLQVLWLKVLEEKGAALTSDDLYKAWSRKLGRPAIVASYEHEVDPTQLIRLRGPYCCYLARTVVSPEEREACIVVGNNDGYRLYLNGGLVAEEDECLWWAPFNNVYRVALRQGANHLLLKLLRRGDDLRFTLGLRAATDQWPLHHNCEDWLVDLVDVVP
jgi:hypothetical protein